MSLIAGLPGQPRHYRNQLFTLILVVPVVPGSAHVHEDIIWTSPMSSRPPKSDMDLFKFDLAPVLKAPQRLPHPQRPPRGPGARPCRRGRRMPLTWPKSSSSFVMPSLVKRSRPRSRPLSPRSAPSVTSSSHSTPRSSARRRRVPGLSTAPESWKRRPRRQSSPPPAISAR